MSVTSSLLTSQKEQRPKVPVLDLECKEVELVELPRVFDTPARKDLVRRAYVHLMTHTLQPKGASKASGHKYSVESWGAGYGMARIARIKGAGTGKAAAGGFVPSAVGGRPTHPPKPEKKIHKKLNKKEKLASLLSAIAFTAIPEAVRSRGHRLPNGLRLPIVVTDDIEGVDKAKELREFLERLGLGEELERCGEEKIRAGKGKMRGRRYKRRVGPLIVCLNDRGIAKAVSNLPGVDFAKLSDLSVLHLAPGAMPARLVIWSKSALLSLDSKLEKFLA
ncbi:MAG: 50S ribosomal protein L4 [Candidatus Terraquivivens tikiterensis]|uniref:Large ribosomal subunit protein uL4 n=1 Tax=Candidatus Terraquivivens tikiterensis TaxID=1980982 RepID=A0A2R7Y5N3_9ARCH|nr:MAG: 50S ribosomal protein L4 [Candidatus Terraquivivens tikiterensis]